MAILICDRLSGNHKVGLEIINISRDVRYVTTLYTGTRRGQRMKIIRSGPECGVFWGVRDECSVSNEDVD